MKNHNIIISVISPELCRALRISKSQTQKQQRDVGDGGSTPGSSLSRERESLAEWLEEAAAQPMHWAGCALALGTLALRRGQSTRRG